MNVDFIRKRITDLRIKLGVSEYKMSLDLGHSRSYIQSITSGRSLPSIAEFLYICEYLNVTPKDFFDTTTAEPILVQKALDGMRSLPDKDLLSLITLIDRFKEGKS
jgi:transcriptional regulator with XRE-family HTH domain